MERRMEGRMEGRAPRVPLLTHTWIKGWDSSDSSLRAASVFAKFNRLTLPTGAIPVQSDERPLPARTHL